MVAAQGCDAAPPPRYDATELAPSVFGVVFPPRGRLHQAADRAGQIFVELMAGSRRIAHACANRGVTAVSFDIADDFRENCMTLAAFKWLRGLQQSKKLFGIWLGVVCASWSIARRNTTRLPRSPRWLIFQLVGIQPLDGKRP